MTPMCLLDAKDSLKHLFSILVGSAFCKVHIDAEFQYHCCFARGEGKTGLVLDEQWGRTLRRKQRHQRHNLCLIMPESAGESVSYFFVRAKLSFCLV